MKAEDITTVDGERWKGGPALIPPLNSTSAHLFTMSLFCCSSVKPYRPAHLNHEEKFRAFVAWAEFPRDSSPSTGEYDDKVDLITLKSPYAIQLVRQVNYGPLETKRYFVPVKGNDNEFVEVVEDDLIQANFKKLNS
jgi:hypothetical protein